MSVEPSRLYVFGVFSVFVVFSLDADERELLRASAAVPIAPKAMDVLLILIENAGQVIERTEVIRRVWPDLEGADGRFSPSPSRH